MAKVDGGKLIHVRDLVKAYEETMSTAQVGKRFGIATSSVARWLKMAGVTLRGRGRNVKVTGLDEYLAEQKKGRTR